MSEEDHREALPRCAVSVFGQAMSEAAISLMNKHGMTSVHVDPSSDCLQGSSYSADAFFKQSF